MEAECKGELAKSGIGRMAETTEDEFDWDALHIGGTKIGVAILDGSIIQLDDGGSEGDGAVGRIGDFLLSVAS